VSETAQVAIALAAFVGVALALAAFVRTSWIAIIAAACLMLLALALVLHATSDRSVFGYAALGLALFLAVLAFAFDGIAYGHPRFRWRHGRGVGR
jgi:uncharacterized membrane protein